MGDARPKRCDVGLRDILSLEKFRLAENFAANSCIQGPSYQRGLYSCGVNRWKC